MNHALLQPKRAAPSTTQAQAANARAGLNLPPATEGMSAAETDMLAFLGRHGALPANSQLGPMPSAAEFKAAVPADAIGYTKEEQETLALLARAGCIPGQKASVSLPGEADGLSKQEASTLAMLARAGFGPSAQRNTPPGADANPSQQRFHR